MFGRVLLKPDLNRKPLYDSGSPDKGQYYQYLCLCGQKLQLDLPSYIGNYQDREDILGEENTGAITRHFSLRQDRSLINGWPKLRIESCSDCGEKYLVYVSVFEPANGWFRIVPQGITQLVPSNKLLQRIKKSCAFLSR